jgi:hypothetical protein
MEYTTLTKVRQKTALHRGPFLLKGAIHSALIPKARINLGALVKRAHLNQEYFIGCTHRRLLLNSNLFLRPCRERPEGSWKAEQA